MDEFRQGHFTKIIEFLYIFHWKKIKKWNLLWQARNWASKSGHYEKALFWRRDCQPPGGNFNNFNIFRQRSIKSQHILFSEGSPSTGCTPTFWPLKIGRFSDKIGHISENFGKNFEKNSEMSGAPEGYLHAKNQPPRPSLGWDRAGQSFTSYIEVME